MPVTQADQDSFSGNRQGNLNPLLYSLLNSNVGKYFHDITGVGHNQTLASNNGLFPAIGRRGHRP